MERSEIIFIIGIVIALIWMLFCVLMEGKKRTYVIFTGVVVDIILFAISKSHSMLLIGWLGGLACGLIPGLSSSVRKYRIAVNEMHGVKNWVVVSVIFFVMVFMLISIAFPGVEVVWE